MYMLCVHASRRGERPLFRHCNSVASGARWIGRTNRWPHKHDKRMDTDGNGTMVTSAGLRAVEKNAPVYGGVFRDRVLPPRRSDRETRSEIRKRESAPSGRRLLLKTLSRVSNGNHVVQSRRTDAKVNGRLDYRPPSWATFNERWINESPLFKGLRTILWLSRLDRSANCKLNWVFGILEALQIHRRIQKG